jgi:dipeptidyl aminopeptidase/acylaminoacyl peptidase
MAERKQSSGRTRRATQRAQRPTTPEDITRIRWLSDPQLSPDGARVAFVVTTLSAEDDAYHSAIGVAEVDPSKDTTRTKSSSDVSAVRPFTSGQKRDTAPRWSPDGRWLAFISDRGAEGPGKGKGQLYVLSVTGGEPGRLTDLRHGVSAPAWSPDGQWIRFGVEDRGRLSVYRVSALPSGSGGNGEEPGCLLGGDRWITGFSASSDGAVLAFTATSPLSPAVLFTSTADGTGERPLADLN